MGAVYGKTSLYGSSIVSMNTLTPVCLSKRNGTCMSRLNLQNVQSAVTLSLPLFMSIREIE